MDRNKISTWCFQTSMILWIFLGISSVVDILIMTFQRFVLHMGEYGWLEFFISLGVSLLFTVIILKDVEFKIGKKRQCIKNV